MQQLLRFATGIGISAIAVSSFAQLTSVGPFTGAYSEGFEEFNNYSSGPYDSFSIMGGAATMSSTTDSNLLWVYSPGTVADWGLGTYGFAQVHSGSNGLGLFSTDTNGVVTLTFANPMSEFGGYFADSSPQYPDASVLFYDVNGNQLGGVQTLTNGSNVLSWLGWSSTAGIKTVRFSDGFAPAMDDLQANPTAAPEPLTFCLVLAGAAAVVRRRMSAKIS